MALCYICGRETGTEAMAHWECLDKIKPHEDIWCSQCGVIRVHASGRICRQCRQKNEADKKKE